MQDQDQDYHPHRAKAREVSSTRDRAKDDTVPHGWPDRKMARNATLCDVRPGIPHSGIVYAVLYLRYCEFLPRYYSLNECHRYKYKHNYSFFNN